MTTIVFATPAGALLDKSKGNYKKECAAAHLRNNLKAGIAGATIGASVATGVKHLDKNQNVISNLAKGYSESIGKLMKHINKNTKTNKGKASALLISAGALIGLITGAVATYKQGQIDQKYTDKAEFKTIGTMHSTTA